MQAVLLVSRKDSSLPAGFCIRACHFLFASQIADDRKGGGEAGSQQLADDWKMIKLRLRQLLEQRVGPSCHLTAEGKLSCNNPKSSVVLHGKIAASPMMSPIAPV